MLVFVWGLKLGVVWSWQLEVDSTKDPVFFERSFFVTYSSDRYQAGLRVYHFMLYKLIRYYGKILRFHLFSYIGRSFPPSRFTSSGSRFHPVHPTGTTRTLTVSPRDVFTFLSAWGMIVESERLLLSPYFTVSSEIFGNSTKHFTLIVQSSENPSVSLSSCTQIRSLPPGLGNSYYLSNRV